jgi:hypothetical protein
MSEETYVMFVIVSGFKPKLEISRKMLLKLVGPNFMKFYLGVSRVITCEQIGGDGQMDRHNEANTCVFATLSSAING